MAFEMYSYEVPLPNEGFGAGYFVTKTATFWKDSAKLIDVIEPHG